MIEKLGPEICPQCANPIMEGTLLCPTCHANLGKEFGEEDIHNEKELINLLSEGNNQEFYDKLVSSLITLFHTSERSGGSYDEASYSNKKLLTTEYLMKIRTWMENHPELVNAEPVLINSGSYDLKKSLSLQLALDHLILDSRKGISVVTEVTVRTHKGLAQFILDRLDQFHFKENEERRAAHDVLLSLFLACKKYEGSKNWKELRQKDSDLSVSSAHSYDMMTAMDKFYHFLGQNNRVFTFNKLYDEYHNMERNFTKFPLKRVLMNTFQPEQTKYFR